MDSIGAALQIDQSIDRSVEHTRPTTARCCCCIIAGGGSSPQHFARRPPQSPNARFGVRRRHFWGRNVLWVVRAASAPPWIFFVVPSPSCGLPNHRRGCRASRAGQCGAQAGAFCFDRSTSGSLLAWMSLGACRPAVIRPPHKTPVGPIDRLSRTQLTRSLPSPPSWHTQAAQASSAGSSKRQRGASEQQRKPPLERTSEPAAKHARDAPTANAGAKPFEVRTRVSRGQVS